MSIIAFLSAILILGNVHTDNYYGIGGVPMPKTASEDYRDILKIEFKDMLAKVY